jgi:hypothetical protein
VLELFFQSTIVGANSAEMGISRATTTQEIFARVKLVHNDRAIDHRVRVSDPAVNMFAILDPSTIVSGEARGVVRGLLGRRS